MANTKSAEKQARVALRRQAINQATKTVVKGSEKKLRNLMAAGKTDEAKKLLPLVQSELDRAAKNAVIHKNTASRHKSRLATLVVKGHTPPPAKKSKPKAAKA